MQFLQIIQTLNFLMHQPILHILLRVCMLISILQSSKYQVPDTHSKMNYKYAIAAIMASSNISSVLASQRRQWLTKVCSTIYYV